MIPRGAWRELREYLNECQAVAALMKRDPAEFVGCALTKNDELRCALNVRDDAYVAVLEWAAVFRFHALEHAVADDPEVGTYLGGYGIHFF